MMISLILNVKNVTNIVVVATIMVVLIVQLIDCSNKQHVSVLLMRYHTQIHLGVQV